MEVNGFHSGLLVGDVENMPYADNTFDFVYSYGVIHHTPNMEKAIEEIYRVLKPGGECWIAVYNKNSWFYRRMLIPSYFLSGDYKHMSIAQRLNLIEYPNTNKDIMVRVTSKKELRRMFSKFEIVKMKTRSLTRASFIFGGKLLSDAMIERISKLFGWYNIVIAKKKI